MKFGIKKRGSKDNWWFEKGVPILFGTRGAAGAFVAEKGLSREVTVSEFKIPLPSSPKPLPVKDGNPKDAIGDTKVPLWLCSPIAKAAWAVAQFCGMTKYGAWNWRVTGVRASVYLSAMQRHMDAYLSGEELDPVDGTPHLGNVMACCAIILDAKAAGKLTDDRPPCVGIRETYAQVEATMKDIRARYAHMSPKHCTIADSDVIVPG